MTRVDEYATDADFIAFRFADEGAAQKAEKLFPTDFARTQEGVVEYRASGAVAAIRERLAAAGLEWTESESSLEEDDMWPEWPEDGPEDENQPAEGGMDQLEQTP